MCRRADLGQPEENGDNGRRYMELVKVKQVYSVPSAVVADLRRLRCTNLRNTTT